MTQLSPLQAMRDLLEEDLRFPIEAYQFIREALQFAQENHDHLKGADPESDEETRHVTGQQLCEACRLYAVDQYGLLAKTVLSTWGVNSTGDFGEIVYNLIRIGQMRKSENDHREDFEDVFDFAGAFEPEFEYNASADDSL
ncbi:MAG: Minf_1886 family protein [Planctomycetota bacterium]